ncbi:glycosyltransferase family 1 protein [Candidatus Saccharibacteria bacterium CPR2]|nr:glycosyltransferase family 1 protein [Candidatus Saccharibacteria bacterium CPR2]
MKIGIVCPYNIYRPGGVQSTVLAHQSELKKRGHTVKVIAPKPVKMPNNEIEDTILIGKSAELNTPFHTLVDIAISTDTSILDDLLSRENFDILHFHEPWVPILAIQLLSRSKTINVATFHGKLPENLINRYVEHAIKPYTKSVFSKLHYLTAVSNVPAQYAKEISKKPIEIIPNGIDLKLYNPKETGKISKYDDKLKNIFYVGRLEKRKGVIYLLKAFKELTKKHKDVRLIIAGDGKQRNTLEQYIKNNSLKNVEFLGFVDESEKLKLFNTCDIFCSPAIFGESFGIVLIEAMAFGKPVVAGNNQGYACVLSGRGSLGLVDPKNSVEFGRLLEMALFDEGVNQLLKDWSLSSVKQYNYPKIVDRYESIYKDLVRLNNKA